MKLWAWCLTQACDECKPDVTKDEGEDQDDMHRCFVKVINASYCKSISTLTLRGTIQYMQTIHSCYLNSCCVRDSVLCCSPHCMRTYCTCSFSLDKQWQCVQINPAGIN